MTALRSIGRGLCLALMTTLTWAFMDWLMGLRTHDYGTIFFATWGGVVSVLPLWKGDQAS